MTRKSRNAKKYMHPGRREVSKSREVFENLAMRGFCCDYELHIPSKHKNRNKK